MVTPRGRLAVAVTIILIVGLLTSCTRGQTQHDPVASRPMEEQAPAATTVAPSTTPAALTPLAPAPREEAGVMRPLPDPLYGVTVDDVSNLPSIVAALHGLWHMPTTRVVFDADRAPAYYAPAIAQIQPVSYIMGTFLDSSGMANITTDKFARRAAAYLAAFGDSVDLWEVGNEVNGEWLCPTKSCTETETADVVAKITRAYDLAHAAGKRTALTLYYNGLDASASCADTPGNLMLPWAQSHLPDHLRSGLDYVFISYYEEDCPGVSKDWHTVFTQLRGLFPNSKVGFGENGTTKSSAPLALKQQYMDEYYLLTVDVPGYVQGHFWWYFREDCVPPSLPLWAHLNDLFRRMPVSP
jgi:hypothetical protein